MSIKPEGENDAPLTKEEDSSDNGNKVERQRKDVSNNTIGRELARQRLGNGSSQLSNLSTVCL